MLQASPPAEPERASANSFYPPSARHVLRRHELNPGVLQRRGKRRPDDPPATLDQLDGLACLAQRNEALRERSQHAIDRLRLRARRLCTGGPADGRSSCGATRHANRRWRDETSRAARPSRILACKSKPQANRRGVASMRFCGLDKCFHL